MQVIKYEDLFMYFAGGKDFLVELGEETGIGASRLLVRKCEKTLLIDRGIAFEGYGVDKVTTFPEGGNLKDIYIDAIILTHIHADHFGFMLPTLKAHPESRVFFSRRTLEESKVVLSDMLTVQKRASRSAYYAGLPVPTPLFSEQDMVDFISRAENGSFEIVDTDEEDEWITFNDWPGWEFGFTFSGHTMGAFISLVKCPDGDGLVFSGDLSGHDQETTKGVPTLSNRFLKMADFRSCKRIVSITEATNGDHDREETLEASDARLKAILEETQRRGGQALFLVFQVNRGPNIVAKLDRLGFKVFVAGGVRKTLPIEVGREQVRKWLDDGTVMFIADGPDYMSMLEGATRGNYGFRPIVTSSATLDQGAGVEFAHHMLPNPANVLISTGHIFDGSAMQEFFRVKDQPVVAGRTIVLNRMINNRPTKTPVHVKCKGEHIDYSAHSYRSELVTFQTALKPNLVFVKHCTESGFHGLENALCTELGEKCPPIEWARHLHLFEF